MRAEVFLFGKKFRICSCDEFTKKFYADKNVTLNDPEDIPEIHYEDKFKNAHNVASQAEIDGVEQKIVRMNVPYSDPAADNTGTFFIGYSRHWTVTKKMLENMLEQNDYLLTFSDILGGQLFFIPSRPMLDQIAEGELNVSVRFS